MNNYFLVKVRYEKKQGVSFLVQARTIEEARNTIVDAMKKTMIDYDIVEIEETKIMDEHVAEQLRLHDVSGRSEQFYCTCSRAKGLDHDEEGTPYCISCQKEVQ